MAPKGIGNQIKKSRQEMCIRDSNEGEAKILNHINLAIPKGKTMALVGPSGGGKTTLCHLIPRFYEIDGGSITIDGHDIRDVTMRSLRRNIGLVQQDVFLFAGTVRENIMYGRLEASEEEMVQAAKAADIHEFIMTLPDGYDTDIGPVSYTHLFGLFLENRTFPGSGSISFQ